MSIHDDNKKDLIDYVNTIKMLRPSNPRDPKYKNQIRAWQQLLNVGREWQVARNQEDFPEFAKLFDKLGKALSRTKK